MAIVLLPAPLVAGPPPLQAAQPLPGAEDPWALEWLHAFSERLVRQGVAPGIVTVFIKDGEIVSSRAYGVSDLESNRPMTVDSTRFPLGSFTKLLTALAVLQLVEQGQLSLTEPVATYLGRPLPWDEDSGPVTLHDLLTHTAGFDVRHIGIAKRDPAMIKPLTEFVRTEPRPRVRGPGVLYQYSNYGYAVAGEVVARATGVSYETYITDRVLQPLGMSSADFDLSAQPRPDQALPYYCNSGTCRTIPFAFGTSLPSSGLTGTAADVARLLIGLLTDRRRPGAALIDRELARRMFERMFSPAPGIRPDGPTYGMYQYSDDGLLVATAPGWMGGFTTKVVLYPEDGAGFAILANAMDLHGITHRLRTQIRRRRPCPSPASDDPICDLPGAPALPEAYEAFIGRYREVAFEEDGFARIGRLLMAADMAVFETRSGLLAAQVEQRTYQLNAVAPNLFAARHEPNTRYFSFLDLDGDGGIEYVQLDDVTFERIRFWQAPWVQQAFVTLLALLSTSFLLIWPLLALRRPGRRAGTEGWGAAGRIGPRKAALVLGFACLLQVASLAGVAFWASEPQSALLAFGIPASLQLLRWVAFSTLLMLPVVSVLVYVVWRGGFWSRNARTHFTAVALGVVAYGVYAAYSGVLPV